jgi:hypothetical protein
VLARPTGRAVCEAFATALGRSGVPNDVLNGKQFTGRFTKPRPAEVLFEQQRRRPAPAARRPPRRVTACRTRPTPRGWPHPPASRHRGGGRPAGVARRRGPAGQLASRDYQVHPDLVRQRITLRLDGHLAHAIAGGQLVGTWRCPVPAEQLPALRGARAASSPLPPLQPTGPLRAQRRVGTDGVITGAPPAV